MNLFKKTILVTVLLAGASQAANASAILGGTNTVTQSDLTQLESLINQGSLDLTNVFTKDATDPNYDDSYDWHRDVDNQGATITVMNLVSDIDGSITKIAAYNENSWTSLNNWTTGYTSNNLLVNLTTGDAFLFNGRDNLININGGRYGATYGRGFNFTVNTNLTSGRASLGYSFGDYSGFGQEDYQTSLTGAGYDDWVISDYETFTLDTANESFNGFGFANSVGDASDVSIQGTSLAALTLFGLAGVRRKKK